MARVKDLWFSEVPVLDADGNKVRDDTGHIVTMKKKAAKHPDNGGSRTAKRWLACWHDPDGVERTQAFARQSDARDHADKQEADAERGEYIGPKAGKEKFGPLAEKYLRLCDIGGSSRLRYESAYRNHVRPVFGHRPVGAIRASEVKEWLRSPAFSKKSGSLREMAFLIVASTLDMAVEDRLRRDNPARSRIVPVPHAEHKKRDGWSVERAWQVRDQHPEPYRALVDCCAGLGLRRGCAFGLALEDIDFEEGKVTVRRQVNWIGGQWVFKLPKGEKERTVPLPRGVALSVQAHMDKYPPVACTLPWADRHGELASDPVTARLLFVWRGGGRTGVDQPRTRAGTFGKPIASGSYEQGVWKPALSRLGIIPEPVPGSRQQVYKVGEEGRGQGMHNLRHLYQSMLDDGGVSLAGRMEFMGHSAEGKVITVGVYGHVTDETFERAREAVDARLFRLRPVQPAGTVAEFRRAQ